MFRSGWLLNNVAISIYNHDIRYCNLGMGYYLFTTLTGV